MNRKDQLIQERFPTIMVPAYEELSACPLHQTRLLIARSGLYIDTSLPFGRFRRCLWPSTDRQIPYGEVEEINEFEAILTDPVVTSIFENAILPEAAHYADDNREWAGWIVWTREGYSYLPLDFEASGASVLIKDRPALPQGTCLALDVHSHGAMKPFFSLTDDRDDSGGVKLSVVLGSYSREEGRHRFLYRSRIVVEGFFFKVEVTP
ncbi:MAG: PRTRC system protein A [Syntrophorhabdales bacterium]|jgi:PRTRC genetic system protein A